MHSIYRFISPSGKSYVGQTKRDPELRKYEHLMTYKRWVKNGRPRSNTHTKFFYALDKYPAEEWKFEILREGISREDVDVAERELVEKFDSFENGYNMTAGGLGLGKMKLSEEHKRKQSEARKAFYASPEGQKDLEAKRQRFQANNPSKKGNIPWNAGKVCLEISNGRKNGKKAAWTNERRETASKRMRENNPRKRKGLPEEA